MSNPYRDKLLSVGVLKGGRTRPMIEEYRDDRDGHRIKATTDELGNTVTEHDVKGDRQDVMIRPQTLKTHLSLTD